MKPALLLIDLQQDYLASAGLEPGRDQVVAGAAALLRQFRERGLPVIHVWTTVSRDDDRRMPHWKEMGRWICEAGTAGHGTPAPLAPVPGEGTVHKTFFSGFSSHELAPALQRCGATSVLLAGVHLHACVRQTALDALQSGLQVVIAADALGSDDPMHAAITRRYLEARSVTFASGPEIASAIAGAGMPRKSKPDIAAICGRALRALPQWADISRQQREDSIERLAAALDQEAPDLATQMAREIGKPVRYGQTEVLRTAAMLRAILQRIPDRLESTERPGVVLRRRPHGVTAIITPWNNPIYISLGKIVPALLCGNTVVWKPSPAAAGISRALLAMIQEAGFPPGAVTLLEGDRRVAEALMSAAEIQAVSITGSSQAGSSAQEICARRRIPLQAELGGNNAAIIWHDADLHYAARQVADGAFAMAGQRCTANRRVIVHEQVYAQVLGLLRMATAALPSGDPMRDATCVGPMVNAGEKARVAALLESCPPEKASIEVIEGKAHTPPGAAHMEAWQPPTLIFCDDPTLDIVQEESFGPVLVVQKASSWEEAIRLCNGVRQGLAAALFTRDPAVQAQFLEEAQAGILKINRSTSDAEVDVPFGGWKSSGVGPPEHGAFDLEFFSRPQTVYQPVS